MYEGLKHAHSGWRWVVLITLVYAIVHALSNYRSGKPYNFEDRKPALFGLIATHLQLVIGLVLYFISPKVQFTDSTMSDAVIRFFTVEHMATMIIGIVLITVGFSRAKKLFGTNKGYHTIFWYYLIGLALILLRTPYPFQNLGAGWF